MSPLQPFWSQPGGCGGCTEEGEGASFRHAATVKYLSWVLFPPSESPSDLQVSSGLSPAGS